LYLSQDLPERQSRLVTDHLRHCEECRAFLGKLRDRHNQLQLLRENVVSNSDFASLRRGVLSQIETSSSYSSSWRWFRIERLLLVGFRRHAFAFASLAVIAIISVTHFAQMRQPASRISETAAVFAGKDTLILPDNYRSWVLLENSAANSSPHSRGAVNARNIYIDRRGYREFTKSGEIPEGAVLILEQSKGPGQSPFSLEASVKDSRFESGWGYFDFTRGDGRIQSEAVAISDGTCRSCHEKRAPFDHVFTRVQEILKTATILEPAPRTQDRRC